MYTSNMFKVRATSYNRVYLVRATPSPKFLAQLGTSDSSLEEPQLEERLKGLKINIENIAKGIASNTWKTVEEITKDMIDRTTLNPEQAKEWGLVHEIKSELFAKGSQIISIVLK